LGENNTGKTTLQKELIHQFYNEKYATLPSNQVYTIEVRTGTNNTWSLFCMGRSYQEKEYGAIENFFNTHFKTADACILSSHLVKPDVCAMIAELKKRFYNVCGVFFENSISSNKQANEDITCLDWDEKYYIDNQFVDDGSWPAHIHKGAIELTAHIMSKI
jgi:GTPase SAR1 family protein